VTGYKGFEDEILQLLNANRPVAQTRRWLDWRYTQLPGVPAPKVFWIRYNDRLPVGMASLIFRRYWVNGEPRDVAVLGDISLKQDLRGLGLGRQLMAFIGRHLNSWPNHSAFVIPTSAAERCLSATGRTTAGCIVPHVLLVDPTDA
jgi:GNAT superfamily N-acetyltransferase